jgi:hypothetical protein
MRWNDKIQGDFNEALVFVSLGFVSVLSIKWKSFEIE